MARPCSGKRMAVPLIVCTSPQVYRDASRMGLVGTIGAVASAWMLREMKTRGVCPKAILFNRANTILAQGAALADLTPALSRGLAA